MSLFEALMLICFGAAWPLSIAKSYRTRRNGAKSLWFLVVVFIGYVAGVIHKVRNDLDFVTALYALNGVMVFADILLYLRNAWLAKRERPAAPVTADAPAR
ncbi:MAG: hypothetical protein BWZ02_01242 [Lentisphaerae bacterium ADurb.BinA184]|nr:MAG: hypothetical protein BWZ02_01242 [Lentisphaerae bacterium ADurb.BinA184]